MKKLTYLVIATAALGMVACTGNKAGYVITGTVEGAADGDTVYLQEATGRNLTKLDTAVISKGTFTFEGTQDSAVNRYVTCEVNGEPLMIDFFLENGKINIALTKDNDSLGCAKLVIFCNAPDDNPFMAGAFHGVTEGDVVINVGVSGPGVVKRAIEEVKGLDFGVLCETIKKTAFKVTRVGQLVAQEASRRLNVPFGIIDLSLAPTPAVGDSVAEILQEMGLERVGAPGTTAALALLNDQVKKGGIMASSYVGGLSGAFIPVSEDQGMIDSVLEGALTMEKLEAMTCVCSVGLDMIAIPGDTKATTISGMIADEMAIGMINQKTTAVRLIPVHGMKVGDTAEFGGLLGYAPIMKVNEFDCSDFINRGGRIPAPLQSLKN